MEITIARRRAMELMHSEFARSGIWPLAEWVADQLVEHGHDGWREIRDLPLNWGTDGHRNAMEGAAPRRYGLTIEALSHLPAAKADIELFIRALQQMVLTYVKHPRDPLRPSKPKWTSSDAIRKWPGLTDVELLKVHSLVGSERNIRGSSSGPGDDENLLPRKPYTWEFELAPSLRRFEGVADVAAYLRTQRQLRDESTPIPVVPPHPQRGKGLWATAQAVRNARPTKLLFGGLLALAALSGYILDIAGVVELFGR